MKPKNIVHPRRKVINKALQTYRNCIKINYAHRHSSLLIIQRQGVLKTVEKNSTIKIISLWWTLKAVKNQWNPRLNVIKINKSQFLRVLFQITIFKIVIKLMSGLTQ